MTAEVAVMNRSAVALAADSAMTVTVGEAKKTYASHRSNAGCPWRRSQSGDLWM